MMQGEACTENPFATACLRAITGCDAGLVCYSLSPHQIEASIVLAPEIPLQQSMSMLPLCGVSFESALVSLAPPEVAVQLGWDGTLFLNGAKCGHFRVAASSDDPGTIPNWLVIGLTLWLWPSRNPGKTPDHTTIFAECGGEVPPGQLIEAWARHVLNRITHWEDEGPCRLRAEWLDLARGLDENASQNGLSGTFEGVDRSFSMLLRDGLDTHLISLTTILKQP